MDVDAHPSESLGDDCATLHGPEELAPRGYFDLDSKKFGLLNGLNLNQQGNCFTTLSAGEHDP
jgi:hypothetical protein